MARIAKYCLFERRTILRVGWRRSEEATLERREGGISLAAKGRAARRMKRPMTTAVRGGSRTRKEWRASEGKKGEEEEGRGEEN